MRIRVSLKSNKNLSYSTKYGMPMVGSLVCDEYSEIVGTIVKYCSKEDSIDIEVKGGFFLEKISPSKPIILSMGQNDHPIPEPVDEKKYNDPYYQKLARIKNRYSYPIPEKNLRDFAYHPISG